MKLPRVLALAALAAIAAGAALEAGVRLSGFSAPFWYRPDPVLGWSLRPATQGWFTKRYAAARPVFVRVSDAGFRDREHALDKPDGVFRVAVLGDEQSEAMHVELDDSWWSQLGRELEGCSVAGGRRVEMLNFAVNGYGTAQELVLLESVAMRYRPDLVLLQFSAGNDPQNNSFALSHDKQRPYFRLDGEGRPRIDASFSSAPDFQRHAALSHELARRIGDRSRAVQWLSMLPEPRHSAGVQKALRGPPPSELWEEAWQISEALILRMNDFSRRNGARFAVAIVPAEVPASPGTGYGAERIAALAAKHQIAAMTLDLDPAMYYGTRWNSDGQRAAAQRLASAFCGSRDRRLRSE
jgi:hypothetical protein